MSNLLEQLRRRFAEADAQYGAILERVASSTNGTALDSALDDLQRAARRINALEQLVQVQEHKQRQRELQEKSQS